MAKLVPVPDDLAKLNNVVKNDVVKKTVDEKLVTKVDHIDTTRFILKTKYDTDESDLEKKIPKNKISDMIKIANAVGKLGGAGTKSGLTAVENKIRDASGLVKKQIIILKFLK